MAELTEMVNFVTDPAQVALLKAWAAEEDRSVSYILRKIIETERIRRTTQLSLAITTEDPTSPVAQMRQNGAKSFVEEKAA